MFVEGVKGSSPVLSIFFQEQEDMFIKKGDDMHVEHNEISVEEFKKKLHGVNSSTESPSQ